MGSRVLIVGGIVLLVLGAGGCGPERVRVDVGLARAQERLVEVWREDPELGGGVGQFEAPAAVPVAGPGGGFVFWIYGPVWRSAGGIRFLRDVETGRIWSDGGDGAWAEMK